MLSVLRGVKNIFVPVKDPFAIGERQVRSQKMLLPRMREVNAVSNHIDFSMVTKTLLWIDGSGIENIPEHRHDFQGRSSLARSNLPQIIAKAILSDDFDAFCGNRRNLPRKSPGGSAGACGWLIKSGPDSGETSAHQFCTVVKQPR